MTDNDRPTLGVSSCLCGNPVRYDGNHKRQDWLLNSILPWVDARSVCPEAGAGLGVPRPPVHLVLVGGQKFMKGVSDSGLDVTRQVRNYLDVLLPQLADVDGFIVKARSPSCALRDAPTEVAGQPPVLGSGLFTENLLRRYRLLPVEDEETLGQTDLRRAFFDRVFVFRRARIAKASANPKTRDAFIRTIESALAIRPQTGDAEEAGKAIGYLRENPDAAIVDELLDLCLRVAANRRSAANLEQYLSTASNWRQLPNGERALRFGL